MNSEQLNTEQLNSGDPELTNSHNHSLLDASSASSNPSVSIV